MGKAMIAKLKTECGHQYTSKLEGMFKDIAQSRQLHEQWSAIYSPKDSAAVELEAKVLTTGFWPIPQQKGASLPPQIQSVCERFRRFYCDSHSGRKLTFDASRGSAELRVQFDAGTKDLVCHTYSMCILLLYNEKDTWKWSEMHRKLGIEKSELERHVLALAHPKVKVLHKRPNVKALKEDDTFTFNNKYRNQRVRVHIGVLDARSMNKNKQSNGANGKGQIPQQVMESRKNRVEAAIVRIMKARKQLSHQQLIVEVVYQLQSRFNPDPQFIKQRVASLIEREYLERDTVDRRLYHYMA